MNTANFIGLLFQSRDISHLIHLNTSSYAEHMSLGKYYDELLGQIDSFTEVYFGRNKRLPITIPEAKVMDAFDHLKEMQKMLDSERNNYPSELQNIIDEMLNNVNNTLYRLSLT